ncbi:MAG: HAMP domain-containing histidine kinase [Deltaproteobacteria bacterium]|nr:HAMP domain-containing histidine kinase [Deltaproteobacteria bacterium]
MRLSLFSRLTLGYLTIFVLVTAVSVYAVSQLSRLDELTGSILTVDNRVLELEKVLSDLLLSQSRYEQRFVITKDEALFEQFLRLKEDFNLQLSQAFALGDAAAQNLLTQIQADYHGYQELISGEAKLLSARKAYSQAQYKQDKDKKLDGMLAALEKLRLGQQQATYGRVRQLADAADQARRVSLFITVACLIAILLLSLLITRSITRPVALLKSKTRDIAEGRFDAGLRISSPPEIAELAAAFNRMCERLGELERMKADFFSSMSHELRTPLTSIKEGTGLLLDGVGGETTDKQRKLLTILAEESNRLIGVVNSLLDLSKLEAGMLNYEFETVNLDPLIRRAVAEIAPLVEAKQITVETAIEGPLPPARLDPERMLQVLRNLLGNAVKFTPKGGQVTVTATLVDGKLQVSVQDSGPGIPAESLTAIFEKFHQGNHKGAHTRPGTGLGLAIAKSIITSHGGEIWAESQFGQGSKFFFVLPCSA